MGESKPPIKILREPEFRGFEKTRISRIGEEGAGPLLSTTVFR
jgi:hypothetical protein